VKETAVPPSRRTRVLAYLLVIIVALAGCSGGRVVLPLSIEVAALTGPVDARALRSTEGAVRGIAAIMTRHFGLPMPAHVTVYVYEGREAFEQGLIQDAGLTSLRAGELSEYAIGISGRRLLLLNDERSNRSDNEWLRLIAHELTHVAQIELSGGEGRGEQWLAEGMAEWVAFSTLEHLGLDTMSRRRVAAISGIRNRAQLIEARLNLEAHGTPRGFVTWHRQEGSLPTYQLAFLMADYLIARQGLERVKGYFASFAESSDRYANFRRALGQTLGEFEADVLTHLKTTVSLAAAGTPPGGSSSSLASIGP
jgi:hypothetical protein